MAESPAGGWEGQRTADPIAELRARVSDLEASLRELTVQMASMRGSLGPEHPVSAPPVSAPAAAPVELPVPLEPGAGRLPVQQGTPPVPPSLAAAKGRPESLESRLGSGVLSKVGVVLLLLGAAWFLKWALENRWIGPGGRVLAGVLAGAAVVLWSERFRRRGMPAFSYALNAVGSGVLYLSFWASFHLYHLVPASVALLAMLCVTAWNSVMAWSQNAPVLAGYALLGAYLTPVLLGTGGNHEVFLFTYLAAIAAALVALLRFRAWTPYLLAALAVTAGYFIGWYAMWFAASEARVTEVFALLLWAIFAAAPLVVCSVENVWGSVLAPLGAGLFGALTIYSVLADSGGRDLEPWWALGFAAVYLGLARLRPSSLLSAVHLSVGVVFVTIAIPLKATGHGITLGWLIEGLALIAISGMQELDARAGRALLWLGAAALLLGAAGALFGSLAPSFGVTAVWNRDFATTLAAVAVLGVAIVLLMQGGGNAVLSEERAGMAAGALGLLNLVLLVGVEREIGRAYWTKPDAAGRSSEGFMFSAWMAAQGVLMLVLGFWRRVALPRWIGLALLAVTVMKVFLWDMRDLGTGYRVVSYLALGVLLMAVSFAYQKDWLHLRDAGVTEHDAPVMGPEPATGESHG